MLIFAIAEDLDTLGTGCPRIAEVWIVKEMASELTSSFFMPFLMPLLLIAPAIAWYLTRRKQPQPVTLTPFTVGLMVPCLLAPFALMAPWAVVPGHLGASYGGFGFFLGWLTKYPNFGPVNLEVLLGILCVLGASCLPVGFALYRLTVDRPRAWLLIFLAGLHLVAYIPVLVRLDMDQLWMAGVVALHGPLTIVGRGEELSLFSRLVAASEGTGAIYRLVATLSMTLAVVLHLCQKILSDRKAVPEDFSGDRSG